jgi:DsbC/DsbD-like thiol-disulfide interchange protein
MKNLSGFLRAATLTLVAVCASFSAPAQVPDLDHIVQVDVLPGWREADGRYMAGIRIQLAPGWKTYWRVPGEGGIPPHFDLRGSENLKTLVPHMPSPHAFRTGGLVSIGYTDEVTFPLELTPLNPHAPIRMRGLLKMGICADVCIPADVQLDTVLTGPGQPSATIRRALGQLPQPVAAKPECQIVPNGGALRLNLRIPISRAKNEFPVIETANPDVWVATSKTWREGTHLLAQADLYPPQGVPYVFDRSALRVTVVSDGRARELSGCAAR